MQVEEHEELLSSLPEHWFPSQNWSMRIGTGGMNNTTRFVVVDGICYVLRVYETHRDLAKIQYEHEVLRALSQQKLPFRLPVPMELPDGGTVVRTADGQGKLAALFTYTEGCNPTWTSLAQLQQFGETVAQLSEALARIEVGIPPVYPPYYEIEHIHPRCTPETINAFCTAPPEAFAALRSTLLYIHERFNSFYQEIPHLKQLPHQLVHGDINGSNMLVHSDGRIAAVLDFEFVTKDVRVMELAVCLSDLIDPALPADETWRKCAALYQGYSQYISLQADELRLLPILIELRRLDVYVHFLGRYLDGVDDPGVLTGMIRSTAAKVQWLAEQGGALGQVLQR